MTGRREDGRQRVAESGRELTGISVKDKYGSVCWLFLLSVILASPTTLALGSDTIEITDRRNGSVIIQTGDPLHLTCRADLNVTWCSDYLNITQANLTSSSQEKHPKPFVSNLTVPKVNVKDVGCLVCAVNCDVQDWTNRCQPARNDSVYLYVKDEHHPLVNCTGRNGYDFSATRNIPFMVPCKPTSPDVVTKLIDGYDNVIPTTYYDPFYGYEITKKRTGKKDFDCKAEGYSDDHYGIFGVSVFPAGVQVPSPDVSIRGAWQRNPLARNDDKFHYDVVEGQNITLVCHVDRLIWNLYPKLTWSKPEHLNEETAAIAHHHTSRNLNRTHFHHFHNITEMVKDTDAGEYSCYTHIKPNISAPSVIDLNVVEKDMKYIDMEIPQPILTHCQNKHHTTTTTPAPTPYYCQGPVMWQVLYRAHPRPHFEWYRENSDGNEEVLASSKDKTLGKKGYEMKNSPHNGTLNLHIHWPNTTDIGEHKVKATIGDNLMVRNSNFYLEMPVSPENMKIELPDQQILEKGEPFKIICEASGYPVPEVSLYFQACSNKYDCHNLVLQNDSSDIKNNITKREDRTMTSVTRELTWIVLAQQPGYYRCDAVNIHGQNMTHLLPLIVTEDRTRARISLEVTREGHTSVVSDNEKVVVVDGDNVTLKCWVNKMLATSPYPHWEPFTSPAHPGIERGQVDIFDPKEASTNFSYTSKIDISNHIRQKADLNLTCSEGSDTTTVHIIIQSEVIPVWDVTKTSMQPEYGLSINQDLNLTCSALGTPQPLITWYKDNKKLIKGMKTQGQRHMEIIGYQNQTLSLKFMQTITSGTYKCKAENRVGWVEKETHISVEDHYAIISIVSISVLIIIIFVFIGILALRICKNRKHKLDLQLKEQQMFNEGDPGSLNPQITVDQQAELLPYNSKYEVPRDSIIFEELLGAGAFGRVYRATALNLLPGHSRTTVAVKMIKSRTDSIQLKALRSEVKIMIHIGRHVNIVNLLGAHSKDLASKGELMLLVEYCRYGNILDYMHRHRKEFINQINEEDKIDPSITEQGPRAKIRGGTSQGTTTYSHLSITPYSVHYSAGNSLLDSNNSQHELLSPGASSFHFMGTNSTISSTYNHHHLQSDMTTVTYVPREGSGGDSDAYMGCRRATRVSLRLCTMELLRWAYQIAKGMEYLSFRKVLHGDLAARNILLAENSIVKISDFGLSKDIYKSKNYKKKNDGLVPVKWLALESLQEGVFSTQSDVWSFGVLMWEIFSLGKVPYPGVEVDDIFVTKLEAGLKLDQPKYSTRELYCLMVECWNHNPMERPSFSNLQISLGDILGEAEKQYFLELNSPYCDDKPDSQFLDMLQSQDYAAKVQQTCLDEEENENMFLPMEGFDNFVNIPPEGKQSGISQTTNLNHQSSAQSNPSCYLVMSPSKQDHKAVFTFDREQQDSIFSPSQSMGEVSGGQDKCDSVNRDNIVYLKMDSGSKIANTDHPDTTATQQKAPNNLIDPPFVTGHSLPSQVLTKQQAEADDDLHPTTSCMQNNPNYSIMKDCSQKTGDVKDDSPMYQNITPVKG
ncbi:hypothetical protein Pmani_012440 [Petrolisthes manimaculis]|uniref:Vascular endothelial growth factor receptor 1 n=1 Tax=Petrolisthes manimaculis TaxID=1843537 RepID=A0AAE1PYZ6_9EUCA|nr:hypothetical protein Pmani_012440 [Petrolisthes manimaculis]